MRSALKPIPGVAKVDVKVGENNFAVEFDPAKVSVDKMLAALKDAGEGAKVAQ